MHLKLKVIDGEKKGEEFLVKDQIIIGRSRGDFVLNDPKVSNPHAKISCPSPGVVQIEDLKSSNGTYVNFTKISSHILKPGDNIRLGKTILQVTTTSEVQAQETPKENKAWEELIIAALNNVKSTPARDSKPQGFHPLLCLEVTQGFHAGEKQVFGFGPRTIGTHGFDWNLIDNQVEQCDFELIPQKDGSVVLQSESLLLYVNGQPNLCCKLKHGDIISFGETILSVSFLE